MTLTDSSQGELVNELRQMYERARSRKRKLYDRWSRSWKLVNNRYGGSTVNWMPQPRDSQIYPVLASLVAWFTDQRVAFEVAASADPKSPQFGVHAALAKDLESVLANTWQAEGWSAVDRKVIWDSLCFGAGIYKTVWDPSLADGLGNANLVRCDPWSFYPDPNATCLEDADYLVQVKRMSWDEFERRYRNASRVAHEASAFLADNIGYDERPDIAGSDLGRAPMTNPGSLPGGNARWSDRRPGRDPSTSDEVIVQEFWLRENREVEDDDGDEDVVDCWRFVVVANGDVVMDEPADELWEPGRHPYVRFCFDDLGGDFWGTSLCEHLSHPQIYLNRLLTALQHNAELIGNPVFLEPSNAGTDRVGIVNRPGQRLKVNSAAMQGGAGAGPQWLRPPDMPDGVRNLVEYWGNRMKAIAGTDALSMPTQRQGERTVSQAQEVAFVRIRDAIRSREQALTEAGGLLAALIVENYTAPRLVAIVGQAGERTALSLLGRHFWAASEKGALPLRYSLNVQAGSSRPTNRSQRMAEAQVLRGLSALDTLSFLEMLEVPDAQVVFQRLQQEAESGMAQPGARQRARKGAG